MPKMRTSMQNIFQHNFMSNFRGSYYSELYVSTWHSGANARSIRIRVFPLSQGRYQEEEIPYIPYERLDKIYWHRFHDEIFRKAQPTEEGSSTCIIELLRWHPFLASRLLNALVKYLYRKINNFEAGNYLEEVTKETFAHIVECLPYAQTTQQNLDSLRAIAYFFPKANLEWNPPVDFWFLSVEFLKVSSRECI